MKRIIYIVLFGLTLFYCNEKEETKIEMNSNELHKNNSFTETLPGNIYVDNTASGENNGTSWENAYESFNDINWANVDGGDTIFISGDATSQTYTGTFTMGKSGTALSPIVITRGYSTGHNGRVIINNGMTSGKRGFFSDGKSYFKLEKIEFFQSDTNMYGNVYVQLGSNITLDSLIVFSNTLSMGIRMDRDTNFTVQRCSVYTPTGAHYRQADGIYVDNSTDGLIDGNTIRLNTTIWNNVCHNDAYQGNKNNGMTIRNNKIYLSSPTGGDTLYGYTGIYEEDAVGGVFKIYNNLVHAGSVTAAGIYFPGNTNVDSLFIYSNTVYNTGTQGWKTFSVTGIAAPYIKNNIVYQPNSIKVAKFSGITNYSNIDNNCWKGSGTTPTFDGIGTWATWQANGADNNGLTSNPLFTIDGSDFTLQSNSPVKTAGATLGWLYATDILGATRTAGYSLGAFEYF